MAERVKRAPGQPTRFKAEYCDQIIEHGQRGLSDVQIAREFGVARSTLHAWAQAHPRFLAALTRARDLAQAYWEDHLVNHVTCPSAEVNTAALKLLMQARFRKDYTEQRKIDHSGSIDLGGDAQDAKSKLSALINDA